MITEDQVGKTKTLSCDIQWSLFYAFQTVAQDNGKMSVGHNDSI